MLGEKEKGSVGGAEMECQGTEGGKLEGVPLWIVLWLMLERIV